MSDFKTRRTMMVDTQVRPSDVTKFPIIDAMLKVEREAFVPDALREAAYAETPVALGEGRVMLEPRTLAKALDALDIQPTDVVLDVACGLGYSAAVMARMADFVVALEADETMTADAEARLGAAGVDNVAVLAGALTEGAAKHGPYDVIVVEGAVEEIPTGLTDQLKDGGRIAAVFAEGQLGTLRIGTRYDGHIAWRSVFNASVPVLPGFERARAFAL